MDKKQKQSKILIALNLQMILLLACTSQTLFSIVWFDFYSRLFKLMTFLEIDWFI